MVTSEPDRAITGYHAHVYYDQASKPQAAALRAAIEARFEVQMGRWHDARIGPHPSGSYQIAFAPDRFAELIPGWRSIARGSPYSSTRRPVTRSPIIAPTSSGSARAGSWT